MNSKKQSTGLKRNVIDKYYTNDKTVKYVINEIKKHITISKKDDLIIEPSAGNGAFIKEIKTLSNNCLFYDIEPENDEIIKQDYLTLDINSINESNNINANNANNNANNKKIHLVGNPPFGRQSSLAIKFIKHSAKYADTISFILPKSFKKDSMKKHYPLNFHLIYEYDILDNSFIINGEMYNVPCVFQIWVKRDYDRIKPIKLKPTKYEFVKRNENPDISFRRVGVYAGKIDKDYLSKSTQSHYFIKFTDELTDDLFNKLLLIQYPSKNNTTGPKSISKQELIYEFNKVL